MNLDFLTPEIFDMLVIANLIVALLLIAFRFYQDMTAVHEPRQHREQVHDESSYNDLGDTDQSIAVQQMTENQTQQTNQNQ